MSSRYSQEIGVPLKPGDTVALYDDPSADNPVQPPAFSDEVVTHNPRTGVLEFRQSDVGLAEFKEMMHAADAIKIV